jgi:tetratricopeptide (TPR) repeat protein
MTMSRPYEHADGGGLAGPASASATFAFMRPEDPVPEPALARPESFDALAVRLRDLRNRTGSPSFTEITRRVGEMRAGRGDHPRERTPGRMTVYDCFRPGRRRIDVALVLDIVHVLGADEGETARWREWCAALQQCELPPLPTVRVGTSALAQPFVGRDETVRRIVSAGGPVVVTGMPGVGKTQLAVHAMAALRRAGRIREVVIVDVSGGDPGGGTSARDVADAVSRALGHAVGESTATGELIAASAAAADAARTGVVLDDVVDLSAIEPFVRALDVPVVVVLRTRAAPLPWLKVVETEPWDQADAEAYLRERIGRERCDAEPDALRGLAAGTGGLPLAADLLAARIGQRPHWRLADHLDELHERGDRFAGPLEGSIGLSYTALGPAARRALRLIAAAPCSGLDLAAIAALLGADDAEAETLLSALRTAQLVEGESPVALHPIIRSFAAARSGDEDPPAERQRAVDRLVDLFIERSWAAMAAVYPGALGRSRRRAHEVGPCSPEEAAEFWQSGLGILLDLAAAVAERRPEVPMEASEAVAHHLDVDGRHRTAERVHRLGLRGAERVGDAAAIALCALHVGQALVRQGSPYARVELLRAQQLADQADDSVVSLRASNALAIVAAHEGDAEEAVQRFSQALAAAERGGLADMLAPLNDNMGIMLRRAGDLEGARERHSLARGIATERGDEIMAALALGNLSDVEIALGDFPSAVRSAREAARLTAEQAGLQHAYALTNLGTAVAGLGDLTTAEEHHRSALEHAERIGEVALVSTVRNNLGELQLRSRSYEESRASFAAALERAETGGVAHERARALAGLAEHDLRVGDRESARTRLSSAAELFGDAASPEAERVRQALRALGE